MDGSVNKNRILVIEDDLSFIRKLQGRLEEQGYKTVTSTEGLSGLSLVRRENPDLIIMDIMLPGLSGHKLCRMIKFDRKLSHIPVIVLTSRDLDQEAELAKQCGADAFILKTTKIPILLDVIDKLLAKGSNLS